MRNEMIKGLEALIGIKGNFILIGRDRVEEGYKVRSDNDVVVYGSVGHVRAALRHFEHAPGKDCKGFFEKIKAAWAEFNREQYQEIRFIPHGDDFQDYTAIRVSDEGIFVGDGPHTVKMAKNSIGRPYDVLEKQFRIYKNEDESLPLLFEPYIGGCILPPENSTSLYHIGKAALGIAKANGNGVIVDCHPIELFPGDGLVASSKKSALQPVGQPLFKVQIDSENVQELVDCVYNAVTSGQDKSELNVHIAALYHNIKTGKVEHVIR